jgi:replicative DNA helicase
MGDKKIWDTEIPHSVPAEMGVIGGVLTNNDLFEQAATRLGAGDFHLPVNQKLWEKISEYIQAGRVADGVTMSELFAQDEALQEVGGRRYLADLLDSAAFGPEIRDYAALIRELSARRRMLHAASVLSQRAKQGLRGHERFALDIAQAVEYLQGVQVTLTPDRWRDSRMTTVQVITEVAKGQNKAAIESKIEVLDRKTGGFHRGELWVLGGRPSMGKSALVDQIETNVALQKSPDPERGSEGPASDPDTKRMVVAKFALEMDHRQLSYRNAARITHQTQNMAIPYEAIRGRRWGEEGGRAIQAAMREAPQVHWDDTPNIDLNHMRAQLTRLKRRYGRIDLITCDYLQIMEAQQQKGENLAAAIGRLTKGCKSFAREFDAPFILLSQLTKDVDRRDDKRPQLADLRDSGSIEADADGVMFCYREYYYLSRAPEPKGRDEIAEREARLTQCEPEMEIIIPKVRMGQPGSVTTYWNAATSLIVSSRDQLHGAQSQAKDFFSEYGT